MTRADESEIAPPISKTDAQALFERRRKAWLANDNEAYMALWDEDMTIEIPGQREVVRGKAAYSEVIKRSSEHLRPLSWEFHSLAVDGDRVLAEWTISGEYRATNKVISWRGMSVCRIANGLIAEWREYWDPASIGR